MEGKCVLLICDTCKDQTVHASGICEKCGNERKYVPYNFSPLEIAIQQEINSISTTISSDLFYWRSEEWEIREQFIDYAKAKGILVRLPRKPFEGSSAPKDETNNVNT